MTKNHLSSFLLCLLQRRVEIAEKHFRFDSYRRKVSLFISYLNLIEKTCKSSNERIGQKSIFPKEKSHDLRPFTILLIKINSIGI